MAAFNKGSPFLPTETEGSSVHVDSTCKTLEGNSTNENFRDSIQPSCAEPLTLYDLIQLENEDDAWFHQIVDNRCKLLTHQENGANNSLKSMSFAYDFQNDSEWLCDFLDIPPDHPIRVKSVLSTEKATSDSNTLKPNRKTNQNAHLSYSKINAIRNEYIHLVQHLENMENPKLFQSTSNSSSSEDFESPAISSTDTNISSALMCDFQNDSEWLCDLLDIPPDHPHRVESVLSTEKATSDSDAIKPNKKTNQNTNLSYSKIYAIRNEYIQLMQDLENTENEEPFQSTSNSSSSEDLESRKTQSNDTNIISSKSTALMHDFQNDTEWLCDLLDIPPDHPTRVKSVLSTEKATSDFGVIKLNEKTNQNMHQSRVQTNTVRNEYIHLMQDLKNMDNPEPFQSTSNSRSSEEFESQKIPSNDSDISSALMYDFQNDSEWLGDLLDIPPDHPTRVKYVLSIEKATSDLDVMKPNVKTNQSMHQSHAQTNAIRDEYTHLMQNQENMENLDPSQSTSSSSTSDEYQSQEISSNSRQQYQNGGNDIDNTSTICNKDGSSSVTVLSNITEKAALAYQNDKEQGVSKTALPRIRSNVSRKQPTKKNLNKSNTACSAGAPSNCERVFKTGGPTIWEVCEKESLKRSNLNRNKENLHDAGTNFVTKNSKELLTERSGSKSQKRVHTAERKFQCNICDKPFMQRSDLERHGVVHTGEKPFVCKICQRAFALRDNLKKHEFIHTGEKPFQCNLCDMSFARKDVLKRHERVHTGERPYQCNKCEMAFTQKTHLNNHQKVHNRNNLVVKFVAVC